MLVGVLFFGFGFDTGFVVVVVVVDFTQARIINGKKKFNRENTSTRLTYRKTCGAFP